MRKGPARASGASSSGRLGGGRRPKPTAGRPSAAVGGAAALAGSVADVDRARADVAAPGVVHRPRLPAVVAVGAGAVVGAGPVIRPLSWRSPRRRSRRRECRGRPPGPTSRRANGRRNSRDGARRRAAAQPRRARSSKRRRRPRGRAPRPRRSRFSSSFRSYLPPALFRRADRLRRGCLLRRIAAVSPTLEKNGRPRTRRA